LLQKTSFTAAKVARPSSSLGEGRDILVQKEITELLGLPVQQELVAQQERLGPQGTQAAATRLNLTHRHKTRSFTLYQATILRLGTIIPQAVIPLQPQFTPTLMAVEP